MGKGGWRTFRVTGVGRAAQLAGAGRLRRAAGHTEGHAR
ncbi:hypothetical protein [Nonomuraea rubra]